MIKDRYKKQALFTGIGDEGQQKLSQANVLLIGAGALGCVVADQLARSGIGRLRVVDRDFVEGSNLQRQSLYTESDISEHLPKAVAAERRLKAVNSEIQIEGIVADVNHQNIAELATEADLILDGTDNFEIRYLINDYSLQSGIPWVFTGCTGSHGQMMPIFPGISPCLRCLMPDPPAAGTMETCDTAGVLGSAIAVIASLQTTTALKILTSADVPHELTAVDVWKNEVRNIDMTDAGSRETCPSCSGRDREWLEGRQGSDAAVLCGRNAVQIRSTTGGCSLSELAEKLSSVGQVTQNPFLLRLKLTEEDVELTVFSDGRAIVKGTEDPSVARSLYSRYIGG